MTGLTQRAIPSPLQSPDMTQLAVPNLLQAVSLAQPLPELEPKLYAWAASLGYGSVYTRAQFERVRADLVRRAADGEPGVRQVLAAFQLASGAMTAKERQPSGGWDAYVACWEQLRLIGRVQMFRALEARLGGILLNSYENPMLLLIPTAEGTWVKMGWDSVTLHATSPLVPAATAPPAIRSHGFDTVSHDATADVMALVD